MKIPIKKYQEIDFNEDYIKHSKNQMIDIKNNIEKLLNEENTFKNQILDYFKNFENCFQELLSEIDSCKKWFEDTINFENKIENIIKNETFIKNISDKFKKCHNFTDKINQNEYIKNINELNQNLKKTIKETFELPFYPPKCGSLIVENSILKILRDMSINSKENNSSINSYDCNINSKEYHDNFEYLKNEDEINSNFCPFNIEKSDDENLKIKKENIIDSDGITNKIQLKKNKITEEKEEKNNDNINNNNLLKCTNCKFKLAIYKCSNCKRYLCEGCHDTISDYEGLSNHAFQIIPQKQLNEEATKVLFIKNHINFIRHLILKFNYILNLEISNVEFPFINDINNVKEQKKYLQKINELCPYNKNIKINGQLINSLESIFEEKKIHIESTLKDLDDNFFDESEMDYSSREYNEYNSADDDDEENN